MASPLNLLGIFTFFYMVTWMASQCEGLCCVRNGVFNCCTIGGACNIFCCNCSGTSCRPDSECKQPSPGSWTVVGRRRRAAFTQESLERIHTLLKFERLDKNSDGFLDFGETQLYVAAAVHKANESKPESQSEYEYGGSVVTGSKFLRLAFDSMDTNADGLIQPNEFDSDLT